MKKMLALVAFAALLHFTSCSDEKTSSGTGQDEVTQKNVESMHMVIKAFGNGDLSLIDSAVADDFVDHTDRGDMVGKDSLKAMIKFVRTNNADMKAETIKELADREYVFTWIRYTGTSDGGSGMPAGPYNMTSIEVARFRDGKAVEHWAFMEPREMMKMMGGAATDTSARK